MISPQLAEDAVQVALLSSGTHAGLARGLLRQHFGLNSAEAEALLIRGRGVIAKAVSRAEARAALPVLAALGLQVAILPLDAEPAVERFDLSVRLKDQEAIFAARQALRRLGWGMDAASVDFRGPAGLEITGLARAKAEDYAAAMRAVPGVGVTLSAQSTAMYDLFGPTRGLGADMARVLKHISVLSCSALDHCPPIAVDLDRRMMAYLLARFPSAGLIGVNQAFQRYHLTLTGLGNISKKDLTDFLATRGYAAAEAAKALSSRSGLRLETGLTRAAAKQFIADYAMIGMTVRADLVRS